MSAFSRRAFIQGALGAGLADLLYGEGKACAQEGGRRMNVLLLLTDDQSAHLGCLGTRGISTPYADGLAQQGVLFTEAFATCASCSPSRMAILTGLYPHANGGWRNVVSPTFNEPDEQFGRDSTRTDPVGVHEDVPTLIEILNGQGYATGITEKFHLSPPWKFPFQHRYPVARRPDSHLQAARAFFAACGERPFFLMGNIGNTHRPFRPDQVPGLPPVDPDRIEVPPELPDTPALREDLAAYLTTVQQADACAGAYLQALREAGHGGHTLVIFTSDQGYCYQRAKATGYDDGLRVPFIVSGPGVERGRLSKVLVSHVDLVPTILDCLRIGPPADLQGRSLRPLLEGAPVAWRKYVFAEHNSHGPNLAAEYYPIRSACDGRFHYLRNLNPERRAEIPPEEMNLDTNPQQVPYWAGPADAFPGGPWDNRAFAATVAAREEFPLQYDLLLRAFDRPAEELYDLHSDPGEMHNLATDTRFTAKLDELRAALDRWMQETGDPGVDLRNTPRRTGRE